MILVAILPILLQANPARPEAAILWQDPAIGQVVDPSRDFGDGQRLQLLESSTEEDTMPEPLKQEGFRMITAPLRLQWTNAEGAQACAALGLFAKASTDPFLAFHSTTASEEKTDLQLFASTLSNQSGWPRITADPRYIIEREAFSSLRDRTATIREIAGGDPLGVARYSRHGLLMLTAATLCERPAPREVHEAILAAFVALHVEPGPSGRVSASTSLEIPGGGLVAPYALHWEEFDTPSGHAIGLLPVEGPLLPSIVQITSITLNRHESGLVVEQLSKSQDEGLDEALHALDKFGVTGQIESMNVETSWGRVTVEGLMTVKNDTGDESYLLQTAFFTGRLQGSVATAGPKDSLAEIRVYNRKIIEALVASGAGGHRNLLIAAIVLGGWLTILALSMRNRLRRRQAAEPLVQRARAMNDKSIKLGPDLLAEVIEARRAATSALNTVQPARPPVAATSGPAERPRSSVFSWGFAIAIYIGFQALTSQSCSSRPKYKPLPLPRYEPKLLFDQDRDTQLLRQLRELRELRELRGRRDLQDSTYPIYAPPFYEPSRGSTRDRR